MRAPRYRFPDQVRSTTRTIATRMVQEGTVAETPEQLDAWISQAPDARQALEAGGYGTAFSSDDLFPLLQVFVAQVRGPAPGADAAGDSSRRRWVVGLTVVVVLLLVAVLVGVLA